MKSLTIMFCDSSYLALQYDPLFKSGGATKQVVAWVAGLKEVGVEPVVLGAHSKPAFFQHQKDTIICYDPTKGIPKLRYLYIRIPGILRALAKVKPDYIYYGIPSPFAGMLGICARLTGRKFILRVSNDFFVDGRASQKFDPVRNFFFRMGFRFADYILCQNDYQFGQVRRKFPEKAFKIKNPYAGAIAEAPVPFEERAGVAWVGIFQRQKNLPLLLHIARALPEVTFKVAGGNDRPLGEADQAALDALKLLPNVKFTGFLSKEGVLELLEGSRLLLNTSHYEGFSNTFLEAFSRGTPVFTLTHNDPDGIIEEKHLGGVCPDGEGLLVEVRGFLQDREAFAKVSRHCLHHMRTEHNLTRQAQGFVAILTGGAAPDSGKAGGFEGMVGRPDSLLLRKMPVTIEFVGHAGSGKTFLADQLVAALREKHEVSRGMKVRGTDAVRFALFNPRLVFDLMRLVVWARPKTLKSGYKAVCKLAFYQMKRKRAERQGTGVIVFDEGMLQRLRSLRSNSNGDRVSYAEMEESLRKRLFPKPDLVVFVVASLETAAKRKVKRDATNPGCENVEQMVQRKRDSYAASLKGTEDDILAAQREQGFCTIKLVNEEGSAVEDNIQQMVEAVSRLDRSVNASSSLVALKS